MSLGTGPPYFPCCWTATSSSFTSCSKLQLMSSRILPRDEVGWSGSNSLAGFLHASSPPVVHGDLKAMNVLVDSRFRAKVSDFGLATKYKACAGTPYWMAPEVLRGAPNSTASDVRGGDESAMRVNL